MVKLDIQDKPLFPEIFWEIPLNIYQTKGKVFILTGEKELKETFKTISTISDLKSKVSIAFPENLKEIYKNLPNEIEKLPLPVNRAKSLSLKGEKEILKESEKADLILIGLGFSKNPETIFLIKKIIPQIKKPLLLAKEGIENPSRDSFLYLYQGEIGKICHFNLKEIKEKRFLILPEITKNFQSLVWETEDILNVSEKGEIILTQKDKEKSEPFVFLGILASLLAQNPQKSWPALVSASFLYKIYLKEGNLKKAISWSEV